MSVIIEIKETGVQLILLGSGFGMYQSAKGDAILGNMSANIDRGVKPVLCCSDKEGNIVWLKADKVKVISIAGKQPWELL